MLQHRAVVQGGNQTDRLPENNVNIANTLHGYGIDASFPCPQAAEQHRVSSEYTQGSEEGGAGGGGGGGGHTIKLGVAGEVAAE